MRRTYPENSSQPRYTTGIRGAAVIDSIRIAHIGQEKSLREVDSGGNQQTFTRAWIPNSTRHVLGREVRTNKLCSTRDHYCWTIPFRYCRPQHSSVDKKPIARQDRTRTPITHWQPSLGARHPQQQRPCRPDTCAMTGSGSAEPTSRPLPSIWSFGYCHIFVVPCVERTMGI